ncbi:MAG: TatD family hydrolase [Pirellulaceae bacterium]|nr:TatD family hydrolase [Pirellulaceae bacterium]
MIIDTHAHLTDESLSGQLESVLTEAQGVGVTGVLAVATNLATSHACLELAQKYAGVRASVGIHPNYCAEAQPDDFAAISQLADQPRVAAIGETGLDRHWDDSPWDMQVASFRQHIALARHVSRPLIIHTRDCAEETLELLRSETRAGGAFRAVMHSFTGPQAVADGCLELGLYISFAGMLTYKNAADLRAIAQTIPADRVLVETDCPYLTPHPFRGQRPNRPALVVHTLACLAEVRGVSVAELAAQTSRNAQQLFGAW